MIDLLGDDFIFQQDGAPAHGAKARLSNGLANTAQTSCDKHTRPEPLTTYNVYGAMLENFAS